MFAEGGLSRGAGLLQGGLSPGVLLYISKSSVPHITGLMFPEIVCQSSQQERANKNISENVSDDSD